MKVLDKKIEFNDGNFIPQVGLGTSKLTKQSGIVDSIAAAIKEGYRHIDTAQIYGNQNQLAEAIKKTNINRKELFITSKIWNSDHAYSDAVKAIDRILEELELDYIDLLLVHWPTPKRLECWKALEEAVEAGKVKSIGISNFLEEHIDELMKVAKIKPVINQFELHPALPCHSLVEHCRKNNIVVESWGTLIRGKCFEVEQIVELAKKYNKTPAQICLRWAYQLGYVVIPKSSKPERVVDNSNFGDFELTKEDMDYISTIKEYRDGPDPNNFEF
ncbi:aldo/keto reductase [Spiroplasma helicoides]|uniref:Aldo/keto reductase n=1 Tax=Spiroplasma helicoides TaxID=216938 RepID=A0A1B3SKP2_9MOLU|nr:aldo/keto reductase [Spiroplasma helicoides]AOG60485.1 aldo/keto reductase [Spiroplasma helicoides]